MATCPLRDINRGEWLPVIWGGEEQFALNQRQPPFQLVAASRQQEAE
jgi:hypothetical protein